MTRKPLIQLKGIIGSPGVAHAKTYVFKRRLDIKKAPIREEDIPAEIGRLETAINLTRGDILAMQKEAQEKHGSKYAAIFDSHLLMLSDPHFIPEVIRKFKMEKVNVESVVLETLDSLTQKFLLIEDTYLRERAIDLNDVGNRLLRYLMGIEGPAKEIANQPFILIAGELTPTELLEFAHQPLKGICLDSGGATSHVAILAGALGIPSVFGLSDLSKAAHTGDMMYVNTLTECIVILHPDDETLQNISRSQSDHPKAEEYYANPVTVDGFQPLIGANVARVEELPMLKEMQVSRIGLFRSEFLFMESLDTPSEYFQESVYRQVVRAAGEMAVLRVLDIGSDKPVKYLPFPREANPSMGFRSIRFALSRQDVLLPQLRAMIRASSEGPTRIIFPMVSTPTELAAIAEIWERAIDQVKPASNPEWGIMVEVPSAVFMMDAIARYTKYISLGTNDLLQFFYAVDRTNERLSNLAHPLMVPFLRLLLYAVSSAKGEGIKVGICGEMAADPIGFVALLGIGFDEFSMRPAALKPIKTLIPHLDLKQVTVFVHDLLSTDSDVDIKSEFLKKFPGILSPGGGVYPRKAMNDAQEGQVSGMQQDVAFSPAGVSVRN